MILLHQIFEKKTKISNKRILLVLIFHSCRTISYALSFDTSLVCDISMCVCVCVYSLHNSMLAALTAEFDIHSKRSFQSFPFGNKHWKWNKNLEISLWWQYSRFSRIETKSKYFFVYFLCAVFLSHFRSDWIEKGKKSIFI